MFAMDPTGVRRAGGGLEGPAATAGGAADRLSRVPVPCGDPDLSAGTAVTGLLDVETDGLRALAAELGLLGERARACAASVQADDALAGHRFRRPLSAGLREALA